MRAPLSQPRDESEPPARPGGDEAAAPPPMPVRATLYLLPDGRVQFGALFEELVPVARALDPQAFPGDSTNPPPAPGTDPPEPA